MSGSRGMSPLAIVFLILVAVVALSPPRATIPQKDADAIRALFGVPPGGMLVFYNPG